MQQTKTYSKPLHRSVEENFPWVTKSKLHVSTASAAEKQCISIFASKGHCLYNILPHHLLLHHKSASALLLQSSDQPSTVTMYQPALVSVHKQVTVWTSTGLERGPPLHLSDFKNQYWTRTADPHPSPHTPHLWTQCVDAEFPSLYPELSHDRMEEWPSPALAIVLLYALSNI